MSDALCKPATRLISRAPYSCIASLDDSRRPRTSSKSWPSGALTSPNQVLCDSAELASLRQAGSTLTCQIMRRLHRQPSSGRADPGGFEAHSEVG